MHVRHRSMKRRFGSKQRRIFRSTEAGPRPFCDVSAKSGARQLFNPTTRSLRGVRSNTSGYNDYPDFCALASTQFAGLSTEPHALKLGISPDIIDAIRHRRAPSFTREDKRLVNNVTLEQNTSRNLAEETFKRGMETFSEQRIVEFVAAAALCHGRDEARCFRCGAGRAATVNLK
jgi:hypothetical protein